METAAQNESNANESVESMINRKGLNAPRVTAITIDAAIDTECTPNPMFHIFPGTTVTVCCIKLRNGFTVVGKSACASLENFDEEIGRRIAFDDAKQKIWELEGYLLRQKIAEGEFADDPSQ